MNMHAKPIIPTLAMAFLTVTVGAGLAEEGSGISPPAPSVIQPQLPFALPELADDSTAPTMPGSAIGGLASPSSGPNLPGVVPPVAYSQTPVSDVEEDIRDIRGPLSVPASATWGWRLWVALLVLGGLIAGWLYTRRRSSERPQLAYEIAFEQLERARSLMQPEQAREYSIQVSVAVRTYLDQRFEVGLTHCTTQEFLASLVSTPHNPLQSYAGPLRDFLGHCDLAKFAGFALSVPQMEAMHTSAWRLVDETRPRPEDNNNKKTAKPDRTSAVADAGPVVAAGGAS
jgi:hypothetical protein